MNTSAIDHTVNGTTKLLDPGNHNEARTVSLIYLAIVVALCGIITVLILVVVCLFVYIKRLRQCVSHHNSRSEENSKVKKQRRNVSDANDTNINNTHANQINQPMPRIEGHFASGIYATKIVHDTHSKSGSEDSDIEDAGGVRTDEYVNTPKYGILQKNLSEGMYTNANMQNGLFHMGPPQSDIPIGNDDSFYMEPFQLRQNYTTPSDNGDVIYEPASRVEETA